MVMKHLKRLLAALVACALLLSPALAETYPFQAIANTAAALRKSPNAGAETLLRLPAGDAVYVTGESGSYYIVEYDGKTGYVAKDQLTAGAANAPTDGEASRYALLSRGTESQAVSDLQSALIELGFLSGKADGKYGVKTAKAVSEFQQKNGLSATGSADAATQGLLFEGKPLNAKGKEQTVSVVPNIVGFPVSKGKKGELVGRIQSSLKVLDYYLGEVNGVYDSDTATAVRTFQQKNGLKATGSADSETQERLFNAKALSARATATPRPTATAVPSVIGWENGKPVGSKAAYPFDAVTLEQVNLRKKASTHSARLISVPAGATVTVSAMQGDFLLVTYQTAKKSYTGYVMAKYVDVPAVYLGGKELAEDKDAQKRYTGMSQGASGSAVGALQDALRELGFYTVAGTGTYDAATVMALKEFQKKNGLLQTGVASPEILKLIFEGKPLNASGARASVTVLPPVDDVILRSGSRGYQVAELQQSLRELGYYAGEITAEYDAATVRAVRDFQQAKGLTVDGVAGQKVLSALDAILMPTAAPVVAAKTTATPAPVTADNVVVLRRGTRGLAVTRVQERLVELGYYSITPDGIYDDDDIAAVRAYQQKNGLTADGVAGLETQLHLFSTVAVSASAVSTPAPSSANTSATLRIGSSGSEVNLLQARLTVLKYFNETIDGRYGTQTASAVAAFQKDNGLTADGVAGPQTLKAIYNSKAKQASSTPAPTAVPASKAAAAAVSSGDALHIGSAGKAVKTVQQALIALGYMKGSPDGVYGTKTYRAVQAFQKDNNLTADGMVGQATLAKLETEARKKGVSTGSGVTGTTFKKPSASEVRYADWYNETRAQCKLMPDAIIYDYTTGLYYNVHMFSFGKHCDAEPLTASDTQTMYQIMGKSQWTPHAVWVILSDGKVYMASTHSNGHDVDTISDNGLEGHICIHFPRTMTEAEKASMPYALSHQNEIQRGWAQTQGMIN